jgi:hypothetical protein
MLQSNQAQTATPSAAPAAALLREEVLAKRDAALAARDAALAARDAATAGREGLLPPPPPAPITFTTQPNFQDSIPPQVVDISIAFFLMCAVIVIGWPLARAFGKRIERRAETTAINPAMTDQLQRIEQAVDAMSIEIERISESQRFMARLQNAQIPERERLPADRS